MFDPGALRASVAARGRVARVVVAAVEGSAPREAGAAMLVWKGGAAGTIGGGALEWAAMTRARGMLDEGGARVDRAALGPALGQCCGGAVVLVTEVYHAGNLPDGAVVARNVAGAQAMPLAVARVLDRARSRGEVPATQWMQGWLVEPVTAPLRDLWVWGAGHVGRALVGVMAPLPGLAITWVDVAADRFPPDMPAAVAVVPAADPVALVPHAPGGAEHLVLTYSHALDLALCHALLGHGFGRLGLIGSASKWARFRGRLAALGHDPRAIARIDCPIGDPGLGKHPQAIAVGVAARLLAEPAVGSLRREG